MSQNNSLSYDSLDLSLMNLKESKRNPYLAQRSASRRPAKGRQASQYVVLQKDARRFDSQSSCRRPSVSQPAAVRTAGLADPYLTEQYPRAHSDAQYSTARNLAVPNPAAKNPTAQNPAARNFRTYSEVRNPVGSNPRNAAVSHSSNVRNSESGSAAHSSTVRNSRNAATVRSSTVRNPQSGAAAHSSTVRNPQAYTPAHNQTRRSQYPQARTAVRYPENGSFRNQQPQLQRSQAQARPANRPVLTPHVMEQRRLHQQAVRRKRILMGAAELLAVVCLGLLVVVMVNRPGTQRIEQPIEDVYQPQEPEVQQNVSEDMIQGISAEIYAKHPEWTEDFLTPNEYSRPGDSLTQVNNIFVHYTANPGTSAAQNRSYFEQQKDTHEASVSSHFIIGYNGEILQIVPLDEIAYAVMTRNEDSISIECCYKAENGQFTQETYDSLIKLLSWLTEAYDLDSQDILRHYDCGGKKCPLYYTEHEDAWEQLKRDVEAYTL